MGLRNVGNEVVTNKGYILPITFAKVNAFADDYLPHFLSESKLTEN